MYKVRVLPTSSNEERDYLVQEVGFPFNGKTSWIEHARVSIIRKGDSFLVVDEFAGKDYIRAGHVSDDIRKVGIQVVDGPIEANDIAFSRAYSIGQELARERKSQLQVFTLPEAT